MTRAYDNWGRLVEAILKREELRRVAREDSLSSSFASEFDLSFRSNESALNFQDMGISFTEQQIIEATGNFSNKNQIEHNGSGFLFRGILNFREVKKSGHGSILVVIKTIDLRLVNGETYMSELEGISKLSLSKPGPLLGHCWENGTVKFVVYSLSLLDWNERMKIAIRVEKGLEYLHHCNPPLVHGDIRTSSVFLGGNWEEQTERLSPGYNHVKEIGTHRSPIMIRNSAKDTLDTPKGGFAEDVYCFGLILLELVTGELGASELTDSALEYWLQGKLSDIDPTLMGDDIIYDRIGLVADIAGRCLQPGTYRPHMHVVRKSLESPRYAMFGLDKYGEPCPPGHIPTGEDEVVSRLADILLEGRSSTGRQDAGWVDLLGTLADQLGALKNTGQFGA